VYGDIGYRVEVREKYAYVLRVMFTHLGGGANEPDTVTDRVSTTIICESIIILCLQFITFPALCVKLPTFKVKFMKRKSFASLFIVCNIRQFSIYGVHSLCFSRLVLGSLIGRLS
jgi:hypothetical protein